MSNPSSLEKLCNVVVGKNLNGGLDAWKLEIPNHMKRSVYEAFEEERLRKFRNFLMCKEIPDWITTNSQSECNVNRSICPIHSDNEFLRAAWLLEMRDAYLELHNWVKPSRLPKDMYAFLQFVGSQYYGYFMGPEDGYWQHVVFKTFLKKMGDGLFINLCKDCFMKDNNYEGFDYYFSKVHKVIFEHNIIEIIQQKESWCTQCVTMPLFEMYGRDICRSKWGGHTEAINNSGMFWEPDVSEEDESDAYTEIIIAVKHPSA